MSVFLCLKFRLGRRSGVVGAVLTAMFGVLSKKGSRINPLLQGVGGMHAYGSVKIGGVKINVGGILISLLAFLPCKKRPISL